MQQKPSFIDHRARTILGAVLMFWTTLPTVPARAQTFADVSGSLKQISASSDGTVVYGVDSSNQVWSLSGSTWTKIAGISLSQVSAGSASAVWGVDPSGAVYHFNPATNSFQKMRGRLTEISAGSDGTVVGVDISGNIQKWNGSAWTAQAGKLKYVSVASANNMWGVDPSSVPYSWNGTSWQQKTGTLVQISASADGTAVVGVDAANNAYSWTGSGWNKLSKSLVNISAINNGAGWGVTPTNGIVKYSGLPISVVFTTPTVTIAPTTPTVTVTQTASTTGNLSNPTTTVYPGTFTDVSGSLKQISASSDGTVVYGVDSSNQVWSLSGSTWTKIAGISLSQVSAGSASAVWGVDPSGAVYHFNTTTNSFQKMPGTLTEISAGSDGTVVGVDSSGNIQKWNGSAWTAQAGNLKYISVANASHIVGVNPTGQLYFFNGSGWSVWTTPPATLVQISLSADGTAAGVDAANNAYFWSGSAWIKLGRPLINISESNNGNGWGITPTNGVVKYSGMPVATATGPTITITPVTTTVTTTTVVAPTTLTNFSIKEALSQPLIGPVSLSWNPLKVPTGPGTTLCDDQSNAAGMFRGDKGGIGNPLCGFIDADYVGAYAPQGVSMNCKKDADGTDLPSGAFFDPIYGGTCWKCPDNTDNNSQPWIRSANDVTRDDACWRVPDNKTTSATFVKYGWAWQCDSGQFWDGDDTSGHPVTGGACWSCPADYPRRTGNAVFGKAACATPVNETAPAELLTYINCPKPDMKTMYPNRAAGDQRIPGKPFLDIASASEPHIKTIPGVTLNGVCWACPVVDKDGNFISTYRSANALKETTGNQGCMITFKYKPPVVPEPGLSGLAGVKEVLFEKRIFARPDALTAYLYGIAQNPKGLNKSGADATAWVKNQWADIAQHPYQNAQIRALMMQYLLDQAPAFMYPDGKTPASPTPAEQQLINAFQTYIQVRRTFIARQALNMYDSWKHDLDVYNASHAQTLEDLSNYGSLPLDFKGLVVAATPTSVGVAVIGPLVGASVFKAVQAGTTATTAGLQGAEEAEELTLVPKSVLETGVVSGLVAGEATAFAVAGGALAIVAVAAVIGSIATDQLMQILTARDNLVSALNAANQPVSLSTLYAQKTGPDQVTFFWTLAMSLDKEQGDAQINSLAQAANAYAAKNNYAKPQ